MSQPLVHLSKAKVKVDGKEALVLMMSQEKERGKKEKALHFVTLTLISNKNVLKSFLKTNSQ